MRCSRILRVAVKGHELKGIEIARKAKVHPVFLSRVICNSIRLKAGDKRVLRIARVVGVRPEECFTEDPQALVA